MALSGCVAPSALAPYPSQTVRIREAMAQDRFEHAYEMLTPGVSSNDAILYLQERGRVSSLAGAYAKSNEDFEQAVFLIEDNQKKAKISLSDLGNDAIATVSNDNLIPYPGYAYEKVFIHTFEALNYLSQDMLEDALVEVRKAQNEHTFAEYIRRKELAKAAYDAKRYDIKLDDQEDELNEVYKQLNAAAGEVKSEFENAYAFYVSGVLYEIAHELDNARVSYQKALEMYPKNPYLKDAVKRTRKQSKGLQADEGRVVILYEQGMVPAPEQVKIPIPWSGRIYTITVPFYAGPSIAGPPLSIGLASGRLLGETHPLCITRTLAARALKDRYPAIIIRHLLRLVVRDQTQKQAQKKDNRGLLGFATAVLGFIVDNADLRSWLTLPQSAQVADFKLSSGTYPMTFKTSWGLYETHRVSVNSREITVVRVASLGSRMWVHVLK